MLAMSQRRHSLHKKLFQCDRPFAVPLLRHAYNTSQLRYRDGADDQHCLQNIPEPKSSASSSSRCKAIVSSASSSLLTDKCFCAATGQEAVKRAVGKTLLWSIELAQ